MRGGVELSSVFPPSPSVPPNFAEPAPAYKRQAWLAMAALLGFVAVYLGLIGYLTLTVARHWGAISKGADPIVSVLTSIPALFLLAFLGRGLFAIKRLKDKSLVEVTREEQPLLFAFLDRLADETHAPRPKHVYLSARVNAAVFYELSFWNLIIPTTKNLELGLGLVNTLTLDELKAVIAHEYGHFAQRTMAVGPWIYLAQQIAGHIVASRGYIDNLLAGLSVSDYRLAWIGWGLRIVVWSVRSVLDVAFRVALIASRALGREMEFQADRVAASVTGSDSLIHALHRLGAADEAWSEAANFAAEETQLGRPVKDLFALQTQCLDSLRRVLSEPGYGRTPEKGSGAGHRVFDQALAQPPRMWLTHPPNREREDSVKATYVPSPLDARSAWELFENTQVLREKVTASLFAEIKPVEKPVAAEGTVEERLQKRYQRAAMNPAYRGVYLGRSIAGWAKEWRLMIGAPPMDVPNALGALYPASLQLTLAQLREKRAEEDQLEGLHDGVLTAPGGSIRYRGRELRRKDLPEVLEGIRQDRERLEDDVRAHDRAVRGAHLAAAKQVGRGWPEHLEGLVALLHVATHTQRRLVDEHFYLQHELDHALADGRISFFERGKILTVAKGMFEVLESAWAVHRDLNLPSDVAKTFEAEGGWDAMNQKFGLSAPTDNNLGNWLNVEQGWSRGAMSDFGALSSATLNALLESEAKVANWAKTGEPADEAPAPARIPSTYKTRIEGTERKRQRRLGWWDRFQTADGFGPGLLRTVVAACVLLPVLTATGSCGSTTVHIVNGLAAPITVQIGETTTTVEPHQIEKVDLHGAGAIHVRAESNGRLIEEFDEELRGGLADRVYDVSSATPLLEWTMVYGNASPQPDVTLGAPRWFIARQSAVFTDPPQSVSSKTNPYRTVLASLMNGAASAVTVTNAGERTPMIIGHVTFDDLQSDDYYGWLELALDEPKAMDAVMARANETHAVVLERFLQDNLTEEERAKRCASYAGFTMDAGDLAYVTLRCDRDKPMNAYLEAFQKHPKNPWLALAAAYTHADERAWAPALAAFEVTLSQPDTGSLHDNLALEALRVLRASRDDWKTAEVPEWMKKHLVVTLLEVEGAPKDEDPPSFEFYRALRDGRLDKAWEAAKSSRLEHSRKDLALMISASEGKQPQMPFKPENFGPDDVQPLHAFIAGAVAARDGRDFEQWVPLIVDPSFPEELVRNVLDKKALRADPGGFTQFASRKAPQVECELMTMASIVLADEAPKEWHDRTKRICFMWNVPYFK